MKFLLIFLTGVLSGGIIVHLFFGPAPQTQSHVREHLDWAQAGVDAISQNKDPEHQLEEAKRYYGKSVILFLASLYHRTQTNSLPEVPVLAVEVPKETNPLASKDPHEPRPNTNAAETKLELPVKEELKEAFTQTDKERLVDFHQSSHFNEMTPVVKKLLGSYSGTFMRANGEKKGQVDAVELDIDLEKREEHLSGTIQILMTDPEGNQYNRSVNSGANSKLRPFPGKPEIVYLEPVPGEFIILNVSNDEQMTGDYYDSKGVYKGKINLRKF